MEFPDLGQHCHIPTCKQLDFLPIRCDSCSNTFCTDHFSYMKHDCPNAYTKDVQVPVCPLCSQPVPTKRGELPDIRMSAHIDQDCQDDRAKQNRNPNSVFTSKCTKRGCKTKEMIKVLCSECKKNFCLKHRHPVDHECDPIIERIPKTFTDQMNDFRNKKFSWFSGDSKASNGVATPAAPKPRSVNGAMSEDEALARALQASMDNQASESSSRGASAKPAVTQPSSREEEDRQLAAAIAASQRDVQRNKDKCTVS